MTKVNEAILNETKAFAAKLKKSEAYVDYLNYKSFIDRQPELKEKVQAFRRKSFEIQAGHNYGYFNAYENLISLKHDNEDLLAEPIVKEFLEAELKVSKLLSQVLSTFAEEVEFDLGFLED